VIVYVNGHFLPREDARISPDDRGFLLSDGAYEVLRSYGGQLFQAREHFKRLEYSLRELRIAAPDIESLPAIATELLRRNKLADGDAVVYAQVTRGVARRTHAFPEEKTPPTAYLAVSSFTPSPKRLEQGVRVILVPDIRWARCDIKSIALLPNVLASQQAKENGAHEAIFVRNGVVTEGSHTSFCGVLDGTLLTHPLTHHILAGITRDTVLDLCAKLGIPFRETPLLEHQLKTASELLILGTTTEITPVVHVDGWQVADGKPGPVTTRLQRAFRELVMP
jgi:D-alanine transaminase